MKYFSWSFLSGLVIGFVITGTLTGDRVFAGNREGPAVPSGVEMRSSDKDQDGHWTSESLKNAKPLEVPTAPELPASPETPDTPQPAPSQSGPGSTGDGEIEPSDKSILEPGND